MALAAVVEEKKEAMFMAALVAPMAVMVLTDTVKLNITRAAQDKVQPQNPLVKSEEHSTLAVAVVELALERELAQLVAEAEAVMVVMAQVVVAPGLLELPIPEVEVAAVLTVTIHPVVPVAPVSSSFVGTTQLNKRRNINAQKSTH